MLRRIAIIGGGASGILTFAKLVERALPFLPVEISLIERKQELGGLAYDSKLSGSFLMNGFIHTMSAFESDPGHLLRWLNSASRDEWPEEFSKKHFSETDYCPRWLYGKYLEVVFNDACCAAKAKGIACCLIRENVEAIENNKRSDFLLVCENGRRLPADVVVLATGHLDQASLKMSSEVQSHPNYVDSIWNEKSFERLREMPDDVDLTIIGTGLSAIDIALTRFKKAGNPHLRGKTTLISRHGLLPTPYERNQDRGKPLSQVNIVSPVHRLSPDRLASLFEKEIVEGQKNSLHPESIHRQIKKYFPFYFSFFSREEIKKFYRRYRHLDVYRTGMPHEFGELIQEMKRSGRLEVIASSVHSVEAENAGFKLSLEDKSGRRNHRSTRYLVNCTGFISDPSRVQQGLMAQLVRDGLLQPHFLGVGADIDFQGRAIGRSRSSLNLFVVGPLWQGESFIREGKLGTAQSVVGIREQAEVVSKAALYEIYSLSRRRFETSGGIAVVNCSLSSSASQHPPSMSQSAEASQ